MRLLPCILAAACVPAIADAQSTQSTTDGSTGESAAVIYEELHSYVHDEFSSGEGGTGGIDEIEEIAEPEISITDTSGFDSPLNFVRGHYDSLDERFGLRLATAYTALGAWANGAGDPNGASGDFDLMSAWTLVGRGTPDTGVLVTTVEYRGAITDDPASALGGQLGTLVAPVNAFNDRGWVVRDAYWLQRFNDGKLRVLVGRAATDDYVGLQPMQNINSLAVSRHFSANPTVPFPGHGPTIGVSMRPNNNYYVTAGIANAYGITTESEFSSLDEGDFFYAAEAGLTPVIAGMGRGRYSIMAWYISERDRDAAIPSDHGVTLVAGQPLNDRLQVWARYAYADATTTNVRQLVQGGLGYAGLFGSSSNMTGVALSLAQPRLASSRDEKVVEVFQRMQLTRFTQVTAGVQLIFDPGNNPDEDTVGLFYARLRIAF